MKSPPKPPRALSHAGVFIHGDLIAGKYRVDRLLAEGGMGQVFVAVQEPIGRKIALKILRRSLAVDPESVHRFFREAVTVSQLHHPNTITILDYGEHDDGTLYIAMEYLTGQDLGAILAEQGHLSVERVVSIALQIAGALQEAHHKNVLHRDLKPANIFITQIEGQGEVVKVIDFGIAKLLDAPEEDRVTQIGFVCGTAEYMAPELSSGEALDGRTDLYALGVMMWELIEGRLPFMGNNAITTALMHQVEPIPPMSERAPASIRALVMETMAKDPDERPANAAQFAEALRRAAEEAGLGPAAERPSAPLPSEAIEARRAVHRSAPSTPEVPLSSNAGWAALRPSPEAPRDPAPREDAAPQVAAPATDAAGRGGALRLGLALALVAMIALVLFGLMGGGEAPTPAARPLEARSAPPSLDITVDQPAVEVFRGSERLGVAPLTIDGAPGQRVHLTLKKEGFEPLEVDERFPDGGSARVKLHMKERPAVLISLLSEPAGAAILRAGLSIGETPFDFSLRGDEPPFGVELQLAGHRPVSVDISPARGSQRHIIALIRATPGAGPLEAAPVEKRTGTFEGQARDPRQGPPRPMKTGESPPGRAAPASRYDTVD